MMDLSSIFNGNPILSNAYLQSLATLVLFYLIGRFVVFVSEKILLKYAEKTKTDVDDRILKSTNRPISFLLLLFGIRLAMLPLAVPGQINKIVVKTIYSLIAVIFMSTFIKVVDILANAWVRHLAKKQKTRMDYSLLGIIHKISRIILMLTAFLLVLDLWGVKIGPLLASLGILGIAVAFGLQSTLGNIFGGASLIIDKSIKSGDIIKLDEDTTGTVLDVGLRATRIRTWDNEVIIMPNGQLANSKIKNYVLPDEKARIVVPFSVAYGSDIDKVKKIVMKEINKLDNLDEEHEPSVMFLEMAESSLNFKAFVWLKSYAERFSTKEKLNCRIYNALNKAKVNIPFPQMDVHLKKR